jgi:chaperonin GroES
MTLEFKQEPLGDLIVVEMAQAPRDQRILLPDWQRTLEGVVVAVGPGKALYNDVVAPMSCKVGDRVVFGAATGMESTYNGTAIRIMRDEDVDGILESEDAAAA